MGGADDLGVFGVLGSSLTKGNGGSTNGDSDGICGTGADTGVRGKTENRGGDEGRTKENGVKSSVSSEDGGGVASLTGLCVHNLGSCLGVLLERRGCDTASCMWWEGRSSRDQQVRAGLSDTQKQHAGLAQCLRRETCFKAACRSQRVSRCSSCAFRRVRDGDALA